MSILENQQELEGKLESSLILEEALSALGKKWELTQSDERAALQIHPY